MKKRKLVTVISGVVLLCMVVAAVSTTVFLKLNPVHASSRSGHNLSMNGDNRVATTINNLNSIVVVGSTAFIVDGHGRTISVDANPYGVAVTPDGMAASMTPGSLKPGDVVVTDFGANSTGTTLVRFPAGKGPGLLFNNTANAGTKGPALEAFNPATGSDWVANFTANNLQVFRADGTIKATITNALFKMPWALTTNHGMRNTMDGSTGSFFITNAGDATIDRIDIVPVKNGTIFRVFQIGQLTQIKGGTKSGLTWVSSLQIGGHRYSDVLLALDLANNRIAAYPNSTTVNTTNMRSTNKGITAFQGKPLNTPVSLTVNPLNGDILVVNGNDNNLVELNLAQGKAVGIRVLDNVPVDGQSGNGSALVGIAASTDARGNLEVFFIDDNLNTLNVLRV